jgi:hypothetical protein
MKLSMCDYQLDTLIDAQHFACTSAESQVVLSATSMGSILLPRNAQGIEGVFKRLARPSPGFVGWLCNTMVRCTSLVIYNNEWLISRIPVHSRPRKLPK